MPSIVVTTIVTVLLPTTSGTPVAEPDGAVVPFMVNVEPATFVVGVILMLASPLPTAAV